MANDSRQADVVECNYATVPPEAIEAINEEFYEWWADNDHAMQTGYCGDVLGLLLRLNAAFQKASISCRGVSSSLKNFVA